jgi:hypothetical protein
MIYSSCFIISPGTLIIWQFFIDKYLLIDSINLVQMTSPKSQMAHRNSGNHSESDDNVLDLNSPSSPSHSSSLSGSSNSLAKTPAPTFNHDDISVIGPASSLARGRSNLRKRCSSSVSAKRGSRSSRSSGKERPQSVPPESMDNEDGQEED